MGVDKERKSQRRRGEDKCICLWLCHSVLQNNNKSMPFWRCAACEFSSVMQVYTAERDSPGKTEEKEHSGSLH